MTDSECLSLMAELILQGELGCPCVGVMSESDRSKYSRLGERYRVLCAGFAVAPLQSYHLVSTRWLNLFQTRLLQECEEESPKHYVLPPVNKDIVQEWVPLRLGRLEFQSRLKEGLVAGVDFRAVPAAVWLLLEEFGGVQVVRCTDQFSNFRLYFPVYKLLVTSKSLLLQFQYRRASLPEFDLGFQGSSGDLYRLLESAGRGGCAGLEFQLREQERCVQVLALDRRVPLQKFKSLVREECQRSLGLDYLIPVRGKVIAPGAVMPTTQLILVQFLEDQYFSFFDKDTVPTTRCSKCKLLLPCPVCCPCLRNRYCSQDCLTGDLIHRAYCGLTNQPKTTAKRVEGFRGIQNVGNSCFLSSALQCLYFSSFRQLCTSFGAPPSTLYMPELSMGQLVSEVFNKLSNKQSSAPVDPRALKVGFSELFPSFQGNRQQDAQEFTSLLLDRLNEQNPKEGLVARKASGKLKQWVRCECGRREEREEPFFMLSLPLPDVSVVNVELLTDEGLAVPTKCYYPRSRGSLLQSLVDYLTALASFEKPFYYIADFTAARPAGIVGVGEVVVLRERYPQEEVLQSPLFISIRVARRDMSGDSLSRSRAILVQRGSQIAGLKATLRNRYQGLFGQLPIQLYFKEGIAAADTDLLTESCQLTLICPEAVRPAPSTAKPGRQSAVPLESCIQQFFREEQLTGADQWRCPSCQEKGLRFVGCQETVLPPMLVLHLKRFARSRGGTNKIASLVQYDPEQVLVRGRKYCVKGICNHQGGPQFGHYTALCWEQEGWLQLNDSQVRRVDSSQVVSPANYLLFLEAV